MSEVNAGSKRQRREFRWSKAARDLVRADRYVRGAALSALVTRLAAESGNPRDACWRFVRQLGVRGRCRRAWTEAEQQRLLGLVAKRSIKEVVDLMQRSERSVRLMLQRLGASAIMGKDWFTKYTLAAALHVNPAEVQQWIDRGWLKTHLLETGKRSRAIIDADDFCRFCKEHRREIVGHRLNRDRLDFVFKFVLPPSHAELLPVRESMIERAAYDAEVRRQKNDSETDDGSEYWEDRGAASR